MRNRRASFHAPGWWPEDEQWPPPPGQGSEAWSGFGRVMMRRAAAALAVVVVVPVLVGATFGYALGSGQPGWLNVAIRVLAIGAGALLVALVAARFFFRTWRPVRHLIEAAGRLADGDYTARVPVARSGSLRGVTESFNSMAEQLESAREQRRGLLADIGHELRTPLTVVRGEIEAMVDGVHPADVEHLEPLLDDVAVMSRLLDDLRTLSLAEAGALALYPEATDLAELAHDVVEALEREARHAGVAMSVAVSDPIREQLVDPVRMREVLANLLVNAVRATPRGGAVTVSLAAGDGSVTILVTDTGIGISPEAQKRVFDRFHKGGGSTGTGLGLTISRDLVAAHGGSLHLVDSSPRGTTMRITLPLKDA